MRLGRQVRTLLTADMRQCAADVLEQIESALTNGDPMEAWRTMKGWYRAAKDRAPKP